MRAIGEGKVGPKIYVEIRAHYLYTHGFKEACEKVMDIVSQFISNGSFTVSRIDLCADIVGWAPDLMLYKRVLTRARKKEPVINGEKITGYYFGKGGDISCRIYNKTEQIRIKGDNWIEEVWKRFGWDQVSGEV